jgi:hypothetical protein
MRLRLRLRFRAIVCRWTKKGKATRVLAAANAVTYLDALQLVRAVEKNSVELAEDILPKILAQEAAERSFRQSQAVRPKNDYSPPAGARLASQPTYRRY